MLSRELKAVPQPGVGAGSLNAERDTLPSKVIVAFFCSKMLEERDAVPAAEREAASPAAAGVAQSRPPILSTGRFASRLSTAAGSWGQWLMNSASDLVAELGAESEETKNDLKEFYQVIFSDSTAWLRRRTSQDSQSDSSSRSSTPSPRSDLTRGARSAFAANPFLQRRAVPDNTVETSQACRGAHGEPQTVQVKDNLPAWRKDPSLYQHVLLVLAADESFLSDPETPDTSTLSKDRHEVGDMPGASSFSMPSEQEIQEYAKEPCVAEAFSRLVPRRVEEELFWKRLHARVRLTCQRGKHLSAHFTKLRGGAALGESSESEEDIAWEDLGEHPMGETKEVVQSMRR